MKTLISFFFLFTPLTILGQTLKGIVYDAESPIKGVKVYNASQKTVTAANDNGEFRIEARVADTLVFESLFHHPLVVGLNADNFKDTAVFELKKIINSLDEVLIKEKPKQPVFEEEIYNIELRDLIKEDIKNNPHLYQPSGATYGVDFIYLIAQVAKLFKREKSAAPAYTSITYSQMDSLFNNSSFFTKRLITEDLNIPEDRTKLFFDFCVAKQLKHRIAER